MTHFHVTLPSNSSLAYYPSNTVAHFTTKLPERIQLDGDYEVGLAEIIYPHSWFNVDNTHRTYWFGVKLEGRELRSHYVKTGYYVDGTVFANELTKQGAKAFADIVDFSVKFSYNVISNKFSIDVQSKSQGHLLYMSSDLQKLLGIVIGTNYIGNQTVIATNVFEMNRGLDFMYVYTDILSHSIVGDTKAPLLRVCSASGKHGEIIRTIFTHPHYAPVGRREFDSVEININTELGKPFPFTSGKVVVTLHFRKRHSLLAAS